MELSPRCEIQIDNSRLRQLRHGKFMVNTEPAVFEITGPGSVDCMQGLVSTDLIASGDNTVSYGAFLTPRGMISFDAWILRTDGRVIVIADPSAQSAAQLIFQKALPPRLAKASDLTGSWRALWWLGSPPGDDVLRAFGKAAPINPGKLSTIEAKSDEPWALAAVPAPGAWFGALIVGVRATVDSVEERLKTIGISTEEESLRHAARILTGWPQFGAEIDEKTLPQEVRYDQLGAVSYTKGCYTGQETVARVHFRGHPNRMLRGLLWGADLPLTGTTITALSKNSGTVTSVLKTPDFQIGLGLIRREVAAGDEVVAADQPAQVVELPFQSFASQPA